MKIKIHLVCLLLSVVCQFASVAQDGNRLTYLDRPVDPYYVGRNFPKLTTPQWIGDGDVEAVVVLAIDDMRDTAHYESYLRPILDRLKQIDGRAPVSIMTCSVDPNDPQLSGWIKEGLTIECHTIDHPCPLLNGGDFAKAKSTYDRCVDQLAKIPGNQPVAFRVPCCDSRNTPSPRFWNEILDDFTPNGNYLHVDSSVFNISTPDDAEVPRELLVDQDGGSRFQKYLPFPSFVNTIKDYPYPYVIGRGCWEFPCTVPSDWQAQNLHRPNNPRTVEDLKAALDVTVHKQGVMNLVFHPHGWIRSDQVVEFIDHAVAKHGTKVKFLTFREAYQAIRKNLLHNQDLGNYAYGAGIRLLDVNADGFMDVVDGGWLDPDGKRGQPGATHIWVPKTRSWKKSPFPVALVAKTDRSRRDLGGKFAVLREDGFPSLMVFHRLGANNQIHPDSGIWHFDGQGWIRDQALFQSLQIDGRWVIPQNGEGVRFRDLDRDGICELIVAASITRGPHNTPDPVPRAVYQLQPSANRWQALPFSLPAHVELTAAKIRETGGFPDGGLRFVDVNQDGFDDLLFSNAARYSCHLWTNATSGWATQLIDGVRGQDGGTGPEIPMIIRADGTNNGAWFHSAHMWIQNEDTNQLPDGVRRLSFADMLGQSSGR